MPHGYLAVQYGQEDKLTVNLESLHVEGVDEVLPESLELLRNIGLASDIDASPGKSSGDGLVDVDHVGEVCPPRRCKVSASSAPLQEYTCTALMIRMPRSYLSGSTYE